jgi:rhodanese-related sulfurtransferase
VVVCHHGVRSAQVAMYLAQNGFEHVLNLSGGIDAWSEDADPSTPRY